MKVQVYVLKSIELEEQCEEQLVKMYNLAVENPLDINELKELCCGRFDKQNRKKP